MEKEQILSTLAEKTGKTGLSEQTISDYIDENLPANGTEPDDAYWTKHTKVLKSLGGNYSHDVAAEVNDFKKNYKPETTPPAAATETTPPQDNETLKRIEALEKQIADEKNKASVNDLRKGVEGKSAELKVSNKALWNDAVGMVEFKEGMNADTMLAEAKKVYEAKLKAYVGEGASPYGGEQRTGGAQISESEAKSKRDAFKKRMQASGRLPKDEAQK